jgi:hypothetical protein
MSLRDRRRLGGRSGGSSISLGRAGNSKKSKILLDIHPTAASNESTNLHQTSPTEETSGKKGERILIYLSVLNPYPGL